MQTRIITPNGFVLDRRSFGTDAKIAELRAEEHGTNGASFYLRGYQSEQIEALGIVAEGAARGAVKGVKP